MRMVRVFLSVLLFWSIAGLGCLKRSQGGETKARFNVGEIKEIRPSKSGGESWYFNTRDPRSDSRFDGGDAAETMTQNPDGSWKIIDTAVRLGALTSEGYKKGQFVVDHAKFKSQGYMQSPHDWKNVEMTAYVRLNVAEDPEDNFTWYARSGMHSKIPCEGTAYKPAFYYNGEIKFRKEQWHNKGYSSYVVSEKRIAPLTGRWIGLKSLIYDVAGGVKLEAWVDNEENNRWEKVGEYIDRGDWGEEAAVCDPYSPPGQTISWGGPVATFRWDNATDVDVKFLSVREIQP
jgi:hypothetical protein